MLSKNENMIGRAFGRLRVIEEAENIIYGSQKHKRYLCVCKCGSRKIILAGNLHSGATKSCGCLHKERTQERRFKHGHSGRVKSSTYNSWQQMIRRCNNKTHKQYKNYGGRGIIVCARWLGKRGFENFLKDMGERPSGLTIERIENNGNYEPENCKWASYLEQNRNRRSNRYIEYGGKKMILAQWARELGISGGTLRKRLVLGWPIEKALHPGGQ